MLTCFDSVTNEFESVAESTYLVCLKPVEKYFESARFHDKKDIGYPLVTWQSRKTVPFSLSIKCCISIDGPAND